MLEFAKGLDKMHRVWLDGDDVKVVKLWCDVLRSWNTFVYDASVAVLTENIILDYADGYLYPFGFWCLDLSVRRGNEYVSFIAVVPAGGETACLISKDGDVLCRQGLQAEELAFAVRRLADLLFTALIALMDADAVDEEKIDEVTSYASFLAERGAVMDQGLCELLVDVARMASEKVYYVGLRGEEIGELITAIENATPIPAEWYSMLDNSGKYAGVMMSRSEYAVLLSLELSELAAIVIELRPNEGGTPWLSMRLEIDNFKVAVKRRHWEVLETLRGLTDWRKWALDKLRSVLGYARSKDEAEAIRAWIRILESAKVEDR